jgi:hypothetical protein
VPADFIWANWIGIAAFAGLIVVLYGWMMSRARAEA